MKKVYTESLDYTRDKLRRSGFTLVEILIVISIIAILSTIGLAVFQGAAAKARDSVRKSDLQKVATALEIYFQKNDQYKAPVAGDNDTECQSVNDAFYEIIAPSSGDAPKDPLTGNFTYCYFSLNKGQSFRLFAKLENLSDADIIPGCTNPNYNYSVVSQDLTPICPPP